VPGGNDHVAFALVETLRDLRPVPVNASKIGFNANAVSDLFSQIVVKTGQNVIFEEFHGRIIRIDGDHQLAGGLDAIQGAVVGESRVGPGARKEQTSKGK